MPDGAAFDVAVIGAGAAGMMCAAMAAQRGRRVALIDHAARPGEKIRISGGGRCNFTNRDAGPAHFISDNPDFCRSALARYTPNDFLALLARHRVAWHEKHRGQLFCDESSEEIIHMLRAECDAGSVVWRLSCKVDGIERGGGGGDYTLATPAGAIRAASLVVATGGLPVSKIGASDFGLRIARQFGLKVVEPRPALVPLVFDAAAWKPFAALAGVALEVDIRTGEGKRVQVFREDLLFTHRGLSGPAVLQISSHWRHGQEIVIDLAPGLNLEAALLAAKPGNRQQLGKVLAGLVPRRLAEQWLAAWPGAKGLGGPDNPDSLGGWRIADVPDKTLRQLADGMRNWRLVPTGTEGFNKAEVMRGGVDTRELDQQTMEARRVPGLYFIGEVVDVTGWLGGYNFQWAWASAAACGRAVGA